MLWDLPVLIQLEVQTGSASILQGPWHSRPRLMPPLSLYLSLGLPVSLTRYVETIGMSCSSCLLSSLAKNSRLGPHPANEENLSAGICSKLRNVSSCRCTFLVFELPVSKLPNISEECLVPYVFPLQISIPCNILLRAVS